MARASEVYEVVIEGRGLLARLWSWFRTLFSAAVSAGAGAPSLDLSRARVVRRADGTIVRRVDNRSAWGEDLVATVADDVERLDVDAFEAAWVPAQPS